MPKEPPTILQDDQIGRRNPQGGGYLCLSSWRLGKNLTRRWLWLEAEWNSGSKVIVSGVE